ncbi:MAG: glycosyltransferase [Gammaproteobacteria bacterium]|nr:glycosyltransferase [Gammaproteobacteria bacterium]
MGAVTFSIDPKLIETLKANLDVNIFVETGTFKGEAIDIVKNHFKQIYSFELSNEYHKHSSHKFKDSPHISIIHGNSSQELARIMPKLENQAVVYWLDAHWCVATNTAGEMSQCPLISEINAICGFHSDSAIIIDDARLFLATPPAPHEITHWPNLTEIINALKSLSHSHNLMVLNDCIVFYPEKIEAALMYHAHLNGIDWLHALDKSRDYDKVLAEMDTKEKQIQFLKKTCDEREQALLSNGNPALTINEYILKIHNKLEDIERNPQIETNLEKNEAVLKQMQAELAKLESIKLQILSDHDSINQSNQKIKNIQNEVTEVYNQVIADLHGGYETIIKKQAKLIDYYETGTIKNIVTKIKNRFALFMKPKLGELNLYGPRPLLVPKHYFKKSHLKKPPTISIVTPSYNQGVFLERTILSIKHQEYPCVEHIIQDGGSTDKTIDVLKRYDASIKHWESAKDKGQSNAINLGLAHATGDILAYLNSDDILLPGTLHYVGQFFEKNPDVDVLYGHRVLIDKDGQEIGRWILPPHDDEILSWADYIPQETLFWRRSIWEKVGGKIDESFRFAMDWDLILRFREAGAKFARVPRFLGGFRIHPHQKTSAEISFTGTNEMDRLRERCHNRFVNPVEINNAIKKYLNRHLVYHKLYKVGILRY